MVLREKLEQLGADIYVTNYAGDIANMLVNKPMPYRVCYDEDYDVYVIADAEKYVHYQMTKILGASNYMYQFRDFEDRMKEEIIKRQIRYRIPKGALDIASVYSSIGNKTDFLFIPNGYSTMKETSFYKYEMPITTGTIYTVSENEIKVFCNDLYNKLKSLGTIL